MVEHGVRHMAEVRADTGTSGVPADDHEIGGGRGPYQFLPG
ncbi:hypothetical protein BN2537_2797 [Streptomyces venezuelae]|nr:hypothetical protein BN2537_2797 [Streptomyces venezuelae]